MTPKNSDKQYLAEALILAKSKAEKYKRFTLQQQYIRVGRVREMQQDFKDICKAIDMALGELYK